MKRIIAVLLMLILICGCSSNKKESKQKIAKSDTCDFLVNANWEGNDSQCVNVITFKKDGSFSNWCYCGSPVGDGDISEKYSYRASDNAVLLYDCDNINFETGKILYVDEAYLIIDVWGRTYCYENLNINRPEAHSAALELVGTEDLTKPCLTVLEYNDGKFTVSSANYDHDAASEFKEWELHASEDITFTSVNVTDDKGAVTIDNFTLSDNDISRIGEDFNYGYFEINRDGEVQSIVFYGDLIIQG